jgi:hypothetical protein
VSDAAMIAGEQQRAQNRARHERGNRLAMKEHCSALPAGCAQVINSI